MPEVVANPIALRLAHVGVEEEAGKAMLCYLLGKQPGVGCQIAKNDSLLDLQLGQQIHKAAQLLPLGINREAINTFCAGTLGQTLLAKYRFMTLPRISGVWNMLSL